MSRYFFHVFNGVDTLDTEGTEFPNVDEVREEAVRLSGAILKDLGSCFWESCDWQLRVTDEKGEKVCALTFRAEAI
jgi:hypothetical protein